MEKITCECCYGEGVVRPLGCPHGMPCPICHGLKKIDERLQNVAKKQRGRYNAEPIIGLIFGAIIWFVYVLYNLFQSCFL